MFGAGVLDRPADGLVAAGAAGWSPISQDISGVASRGGPVGSPRQAAHDPAGHHEAARISRRAGHDSSPTRLPRHARNIRGPARAKFSPYMCQRSYGCDNCHSPSP